MERLTERVGENGRTVIYVGEHKQYEDGDIPCEISDAAKREVLKRLAAYEDTGLEPADIEELQAKVPHWISVEERLPEPFVCVLAHIPGEKPFPTVKSAFLEKNGLWYSNGFRYKPEEVTHWCEMPEPPKGVE